MSPLFSVARGGVTVEEDFDAGGDRFPHFTIIERNRAELGSILNLRTHQLNEMACRTTSVPRS